MLTTLWIRTPPGRFLLREWEDRCIVFDLLSNDTHACDTLSTVALQQLGDGPAELGRLAQDVAAQMGCRCDAEFAASTRTALESLERIGVVEQIAP